MFELLRYIIKSNFSSMIKNYKSNSKQQTKSLPKKSTVDFILNYSKSTTAVKSGKLDFITFQN